MIVWRSIIVALFAAAWTATDGAEEKNYTGSYLIVAPQVIRPGLPYSVSVNILEASEPVIVNLRIQDDQNNTIEQTWARDLKPGQPQTATFKNLPNTLSGETFRLYAKGQHASSSKLLFENTQPLRLNEKSRSIFIQTDRAIYKPGATVHFRIVVVTPDLKPYKGKAQIKVSDPSENVIKQYKDETFDGGVLGKGDKFALQLSEDPPLGDWKVTVDVDGQTAEKTFTVDKYVLPKFEVTVKPPPYISVMEDCTVIVSAKYTYGKGVEGTALIIAGQESWGMPEREGKVMKKVELNNGEITVRFYNSELREKNLLTEYGYNSIIFTAVVTETLTGSERNGTASVTAYKHTEDVKIAKESETFKPGMAYRVNVSVVYQDSTPLRASAHHNLTLTTFYMYPYVLPSTTPTTARPTPSNVTVPDYFIEPFIPTPQEETEITQQLTLDQNGQISVVLTPPSNATSMRIEARYGNKNSEIYAVDYVDASKSPTNSFLQLVGKKPSVKAGEEMQFDVRATDGIDVITVQVLSKGFIVLSQKVPVSGDSAKFAFATTNEMSPKARVIAYAVRPDNKEILVDAMDFSVEGLFKNNVSISVNPDRAEPNQTVSFTVKAAPSSYVGLLAVDQSVLLLKSGNDITADMVEGEIAQFDSTGYGGWYGRFDRRRKRSVWCRWCWYNVGGKDAATVFENSGVVVLTDAYLYQEILPPSFFGGVLGPVAAGPMGPPGEAGFAAAAGEPAAESGVGAAAAPKAPTIRRNFPETWFWADQQSRADGTATYTATVPDTITSWIATAFAINDRDGLGVGPDSTKLTVFRPFFIRLDLPYSVKRGETLALQVLVFNYMETEQMVTVTLDHNENSGFDFVEKSGATKDKGAKKPLNIRQAKVPGGGGSKAVYFPIVPTIVGDVKILVTAIGGSASDAIEMPLLVEAEGYPTYKTAPLVLEVNQGSSLKRSVKLEIPSDAVSGSSRAELSASGDIMGPVLNNIDKLIQMPYGCGEQNMLNFVPNIVVMRYLTATQRLTDAQKAKATKYMEAGYQREMTYQRDDSSYSAFGKSDPAGSTWLTAFVARAFKQADKYIYIDTDKLAGALKFLKSQQKENGVFEEHGTVHHKDMQGGSAQGGVPLTAYVYLALFENGEKNADALNYLERSLDQISSDPYALAITSYALHLVNSSKKDDAFQKLQALAITQDVKKFWKKTVRDAPESEEPAWWNQPRPVDVEMTAYALLSYVARGQTTEALPIVRWLASQRNAYGGFSSTQDTVIALQALGAYAEKVFSNDTNVALTVRNGDKKQTLNINKDNAIILQTVLLSNLNNSIDVEATGRGIAFAQVSYKYNMPKRQDPKPFICDQKVNQASSNDINLELCCHYALTGRSNMAVIEVQAPSGFTINSEKLNELTSIKDIQRVELAKGDTYAYTYLNSLGSTPLCMNVTSERVYQVIDQKPSLFVVYDYYDPGRRLESEYTIGKRMTMNDVCSQDCWSSDPVAAASTSGASGILRMSCWCVLLTCWLLRLARL